MTRQSLLALALGTALIVPGAATASVAQTPADASKDIPCLAIGLLIASEDSAEAKSNGSMFALYFFSRARSTLSEVEVQQAIAQEVARMKADPERIPTEAQRCSAELAVVGEELSRIGSRLNPSE